MCKFCSDCSITELSTAAARSHMHPMIRNDLRKLLPETSIQMPVSGNFYTRICRWNVPSTNWIFLHYKNRTNQTLDSVATKMQQAGLECSGFDHGWRFSFYFLFPFPTQLGVLLPLSLQTLIVDIFLKR